MDIITIIKNSKKPLSKKIITSIFIQGLQLIIPVYWATVINKVTNMEYTSSYKLIIITLLLTLFYYLWSYLNQLAWYNLYNKIYLEYTTLVTNANLDNISLGEYTNIINNDIDIIGTFIGNLITRIIQVLEFLVIYSYFLKVDFYIFLVTITLSIMMFLVILYYGSNIEIKNKTRKDNLDYKTINIHNIYDILKQKKKTDTKILIKSTITYLDSNARFNILVNAMIYIILSIIEVSRYLIIIYSVHLVSIGSLEIGTILLIYSYYQKILTNFEVLGTINAEFRSVKVSINRLNRIKSFDKEVTL